MHLADRGNPTVRGRRLAAELRRLRERTALTEEEGLAGEGHGKLPSRIRRLPACGGRSEIRMELGAAGRPRPASNAGVRTCDDARLAIHVRPASRRYRAPGR